MWPQLSSRGKIVSWCFFTCSIVAAPSVASAHDFWLRPSTFNASIDRQVGIRLFVGENFVGDALPRITDWFKRFDVTHAGQTVVTQGSLGDDPAGHFSPKYPGVHVIAYESNRNSVQLPPQKFESYLNDEGLEHVITSRKRQNSSSKQGREHYYRCAKSLVVAGDASNVAADTDTGMTLELVAQSNPFLHNQPVILDLQIRDQPAAEVLVVAFSEGNPTEKIRRRTNRSGRVHLPIIGKGVWLIKAVYMEPARAKGADWASYWASLTFERR